MVNAYLVGHPRSGNHYVVHLLELNFKGKYTKKFGHYGSMPINKKQIPNYKFIYLYRNFDAVSKSIFRLKGRHGVPEDLSFKDFIDKPAKDWFVKGGNNAVTRTKLFDNGRLQTKKEGGRTTPVGPLSMRLEDFHKASLKNWFEYSKKYDNIHLLKYEDLMNDFDNTMDNLSIFLFGKTFAPYKNVVKKVGISNPNDKKIHHGVKK
ncbi:MAG: sulfotransferase domain-containing protein [Candidatus Peribacteraceae bacterium]|nr:sulfotransferase domain-containing protein [Candidatus Peribacteraceae bacterium]